LPSSPSASSLNNHPLFRSPLSCLQHGNHSDYISANSSKKNTRHYFDSRLSTPWITPSKQLLADDHDPIQLEGPKENAINVDDTCLELATNTGDKEAMFGQFKGNREGDDHYGIKRKSNNMIQVSVFHIFPTGLCCSRCNKPICCGIETVRRHMRLLHLVLFGNIGNFSKFHATILSATNQLKELQLPMAVKPGDPVFRFKCLSCHHSYLSLQSFNKHVRKSTGLCTSSIPISTSFATLGCGRFVEATLLSTLPSIHDVPVADSDTTLPFSIVEKAFSNYVPEDEDVDTFVSLFTPLIAMDTTFELAMSGYIDQYKNPKEHSHLSK
jgi:hypothetical protein